LDIVDWDFDLFRVTEDILGGAKLHRVLARPDQHLIVSPPQAGTDDSSTRATSDVLRIFSVCSKEL
jgi:hypothetical protein